MLPAFPIAVTIWLNPFDRHGFVPLRTGKIRLEAGFFREHPIPNATFGLAHPISALLPIML
jgi:hypothetical protein